jgi:undecaprenyl pyrophosphate synthase
MHVAIIMNGNGRWAIQRALPSSAGHTAAGAGASRSAVESSVERDSQMRMHLRIVVDYSAPDYRVKTLLCSAHPPAPQSFDRQLRREARKHCVSNPS